MLTSGRTLIVDLIPSAYMNPFRDWLKLHNLSSRGFGAGRNHRDRDLVLVLDIVCRDHGLVLDIDRELRSSSRY